MKGLKLTQKNKIAAIQVIGIGVIPVVLMLLGVPVVWVLSPIWLWSMGVLVSLWSKLAVTVQISRMSKQLTDAIMEDNEEYDNELTEIPSIGE